MGRFIEQNSYNIRFIRPSITNDFFAKHLVSSGYEVLTFQKYDFTILNGMAMLISKCIRRNVKRIYNRRALAGYEGTYVVFDSMTNIRVLKRLCDDNPHARFVYFIWNPLSKVKIDLNKAESFGYEIWSYGKKQCLENGFKQNTYFYCESMYEDALKWQKEHPEEYKYDICFVGKDKGRMAFINEWLPQYAGLGLKIHLHFTADHFWERYKKKDYRKSISYETMQLVQAKSNAILEIIPSCEVDTTMRVLDSIVLNKKLITNSTGIKECDYYHPNNIFVIGDDREDSLDEFLRSSYVELPELIIKRYYVDEWVRRFIDNRPINDEKYV